MANKTKPHITNKALRILRVAVPSPLRRLFDYTAPQIHANILPGARVLVPFGRQKLYGIVIEITTESELPTSKLKPIFELIDEKSVLTPTLMTLCSWASSYYHYPLGMILDTALPAWLRRGRPACFSNEIHWQLTPLGQSIDPDSCHRAKRQQALLKLLQKHASGLPEKTLNAEGFSKSVYEALEKKDWLYSKEVISQAPVSKIIHLPNQSPITLNREQTAAIEQIKAHFNGFTTFFLDGVTGSGKTEVYMQLIKQAIANNQQSLILIPEIGLTPQTVGRFQARFDTSISVLHSQLTDKERFHAWLQASDGTAKIIIGTRSAAWVPLKNPGLFIVDEEHDLSFKQQDNFRYSARDLLIKRAQLENCPIILGSATPSLETWQNAQLGRYQQLSLPNRAGHAIKPSFEILDIRHKKLEAGLSRQLLTRIKEHLDKQGQVLLFLNRRGYAPVLLCGSCGWHKQCHRCDSNLIYHHHSQLLRCHHCESQMPVPNICPECDESNFVPLGLGTERLEEVLNELFPTAEIARVDRDTMQTKHGFQSLLEAVHQGKIDILIGTQMLAKGHHFPNLSLVAILDVDSALFSADFRATERMGQLITQVAGRAGREKSQGLVVLQTHQPDHPLLQTVIRQDYHQFLGKLIEERATVELPPFSHQVLIRAESKKTQAPLSFLRFVKQLIEQLPKDLKLLGPVPAPMAKRVGFHRAQLLLQAKNRSSLMSYLLSLLPILETHKLSRTVKWTIDVDPLDMY